MEFEKGKMYNITSVSGDEARGVVFRMKDVLGVLWFEPRYTRGIFPVNPSIIDSYEEVDYEQK